jgi:transcriptional regulator with XRE-family HTH domain
MEFRIKEAREAAQLTQAQLAEQLGISYATLSGYETGKHDPKSETLVKIAKICGTSVDFLLGRNKPASDILYISRPSGSETTDELRKRLHDLIDQLDDESLRLLSDVTIRFAKSE